MVLLFHSAVIAKSILYVYFDRDHLLKLEVLAKVIE